MRKFTLIFTGILFSIYVNATECDNLTLTTGTYSETDDLIAAIQGEFGSSYTIADWTDLETISDINEWISCMGLLEDQTFMLTRNGECFYNGNRQYYVYYSSDGVPYAGFLVHEQIGGLYLGSWYGLDYNVLAKKGAITVDDFITEFHDLNNNEIPEGWELFITNDPVNLEAGKLIATPIDAAGCLMRSGVVPEGTTMMGFEWDGNLAYSYFGMCNQLQLDFNQDEYLKLYITSDYNFGTEINRMFIWYFDGTQQTVVYQTDIPIEWTDFHYKVEIWEGNLKLTSTILSNSEIYFDETFAILNLIPSYSLSSINKVRFWACTTTDNDNWLDNISIEIDNSLGIYSNEAIHSINVYPNPATNRLNVKNNDGNLIFGIYNLHGQKVLEISELFPKNINISKLPLGIYFLKYVSKDGHMNGAIKFLKK